MAVRNPLVAAVLGDHLTKAVSPETVASVGEEILGHRFARPELLREALTHRSAAVLTKAHGRSVGSNERLEFVGDRVLGLLIAEWLAERFPHEQEGELGRRLAHLVSQPVLATIAETSGFPAALSVSAGESRAGVRKRATVLADAVEATLGALYLDGGIPPARAFVRRVWETAMSGQAAPPKDAKTALQEWAQGRGHPLPDYVVTSREGPAHSPVFVISVTVDGRTGSGTSGTKRAAEQSAAQDLMAKLGGVPK